jgi:type VI secretion system secreted protein Hcp
MAFDAFLKIVPSGNRDNVEFEVLSFRIGETTRPGGGASGRGMVNYAPLVVIKRMDQSSPQLWEASIAGRHIQTATLTVSPISSDPTQHQPTLKWTLGNVLIASIQVSGAEYGDDAPLEEVSFNYTKIEIEYKAQNGT